MKTSDATSLIERGFSSKLLSTHWADLGCGSGVFTNALAGLLGDASKIYAVDRDDQHLKILETYKGEIEFIKLDFIQDPLPFVNLDGILMANSLHFVKDKSAFAEKIKKHLKRNGQLIIVEYDTERQNRWVPYPASFDKLTQIFSAAGFTSIKKIGERNSVYRSEKMYASSIGYS
jgi:ubiquinone/menaquinone biosynthesis C-methylase UbiE